MSLFIDFWEHYGDKPVAERKHYFESLSKLERENLLRSFYEGGWDKYFVKNHIDRILDQIKEAYSIDLLDWRIKAIKNKIVFFINRHIWEQIEEMLLEFQDYYNTEIIFGGLTVEPYNSEYYKVQAKQPLVWRNA